MANVTKTSGVQAINQLLITPVNAQIAWGTDSMPSGALPGWFLGSRAGYPQLNEADAMVAGVTTATGVIQAMARVTSALRLICRKRIVIYFQGNGYRPPRYNTNYYGAWTEVQSDQTAIGYFNSNPLTMQVPPTYVQPGQTLRYADVQSYANWMYGTNWWGTAGGPTVQTLTNTVCHYNCHGNCHGNRGRR